jgi:ankyrin repeat protein
MNKAYTLGYERGEADTINRLLSDACMHGNLEVVRFLLEREKPTQLCRALDYAQTFKHTEIIRMLAKHIIT